MEDTERGYYALMVSIFGNIPPEEAFFRFEHGKPERVKYKRTTITQEDEVDMMLMREQGFSNKAVGDMYGISEHATAKRVERQRRKREAIKSEITLKDA